MNLGDDLTVFDFTKILSIVQYNKKPHAQLLISIVTLYTINYNISAGFCSSCCGIIIENIPYAITERVRYLTFWRSLMEEQTLASCDQKGGLARDQ